MALEALKRLDVAAYKAVADSHTPLLDPFLRRLSHAANYSRISIALAGVMAATQGDRGRQAARLGLASVAITSAVGNQVAKRMWRRRRPKREAFRVPLRRHVRMPTSHSFPSGHTAAAFAFARGAGRAMPEARLPLLAVAALVGYSRVHTGVHYPSDVLAGAALGTCLADVTTRALAPPDRGDVAAPALAQAEEL